MKVPSLNEIKTHRKRTPDDSCVLDKVIPVPHPPSSPSPPIIGSGKAHENLAKRYENPIEKRQKAEISFTLHPPEGKFTQEEIRKTPAYVTERIMSIGYHNDEQLNEQHLGKLVDLKLAKTGFEKEEQRKPIYAIEALLTAHEAGLYPPMWALNDIVERFGKWYRQKGKTSLDMFFGVDGYSGWTNIFETDELARRDYFLCFRAYLLISRFDFSIKTASKIIAKIHKESNLRASSIETKYIKGDWVNTFKPLNKRVRYLLWGAKKKRDFLEQFSKETNLLNKKGKSIADLIYDTHRR